MGLGNLNPGCTCCGGVPARCDVCVNNSIALNYVVDLQGTWSDPAVPGYCSCSRMDNISLVTAIIPANGSLCFFTQSSIENPCWQVACIFRETGDPPHPQLPFKNIGFGCPDVFENQNGGLTLQLEFLVVGSDYVIRGTVVVAGGTYVFEKNYGATKPSCLELVDEPLDLVSSSTDSGACVWNSPQLLITAVV